MGNAVRLEAKYKPSDELLRLNLRWIRTGIATFTVEVYDVDTQEVLERHERVWLSRWRWYVQRAWEILVRTGVKTR